LIIVLNLEWICRCFNQNDYDFSQEVRSTQLPHLFEHILLEYLCDCAYQKGNANVTYRGETSWNWQLDPRGTFTVTIDTADQNLLKETLPQSIELFNRIILQSPMVAE
jgi:hypothetical protein